MVYYDILGTSDKLSEAQMNSIISGRKKVVELAKEHQGKMFINGPAEKRRVSLTFDDGPEGLVTPKLIDTLKTYNIKANFFCVGQQVDYFPNIVKRAYEEGHLILNHSFNHMDFTKLSAEKIKEEINSAENRIESIIGRRPEFFRPPYGGVDERALSSITLTGNKTIIWSIDSMDWVPQIDKQTILRNVLGNVRPGDIILMHSLSGNYLTAEVLPDIINGLKRLNFEIVDLGILLGLNPYK